MVFIVIRVIVRVLWVIFLLELLSWFLGGFSVLFEGLVCFLFYSILLFLIFCLLSISICQIVWSLVVFKYFFLSFST